MALMSQVGLEFVARNRAMGVMTSFQRGLSGLTRHLFSLRTAFVSLAGTAGIGYMLKQQLAAVDQLGKLSDRLQLSTQALAAWDHAATIAGADVGTLHKALEVFVRRIGEAKQGLGEGRRALEQLGISSQALISMGTEEAFLQIAERIKNAGTAAERAALAYQFFGRQGQDLLNLFLSGRKGIEDMRREAEKFGLTFSRIDASQVEKANDALTRMRALFTGAFRVSVIELSPYIEDAATKFIEWATAGEGLAPKLRTAFESVAENAKDTAEDIRRMVTDMNRLLDRLDFMSRARQAGLEASRKLGLLEPVVGIQDPLRPRTPAIEDREEAVRRLNQLFGIQQQAAERAAVMNSSMQADVLKTAQIVEDAGIVESQNLKDRFVAMQQYYAEIRERSRDAYGVAMEYAGMYARQVQDDFVRLWDPFIDGTKSAKEAMLDFFRDMLLNLAKAQAQMAMMRLWDRAIGPSFGGLSQTLFGLPATLFHEGGLVGEVAASRMIPAAAFAGAPRLHEGLGADEFPAILQRGERVLPAGAGQPVINYNVTIKAMDSQDVQRALYKEKDFIGDLGILLRRSNHALRRVDE